MSKASGGDGFPVELFQILKDDAVKVPHSICHKGGVICMSDVTDTSPGNLDSSLCFLQPSVSHDVLCI